MVDRFGGLEHDDEVTARSVHGRADPFLCFFPTFNFLPFFQRLVARPPVWMLMCVNSSYLGIYRTTGRISRDQGARHKIEEVDKVR